MAQSLVQVQFQRPEEPRSIGAKLGPGSGHQEQQPRNMNRPETESSSPVNQNGSFAVDRVLKSGSLRRRTRKTKSWKSIYLVMRPNRLSIYKDEKEDRLRHQIYLNDLTAVAFLKDPKHKREHIFGLFSPSKNFHFEAPTQKEAEEWV
ncbi:putative PH domain-containing protein PB16A4.02c-like protein [Emericellopsis cladophorae]|uniref:PH domain-containing protein PB16A4.02c-like protein n=1 Tax=Emericellopsis cladophorae TaxID=2686198 RepID=A0A9Q0B7W2_9HYPO|nr:putative PH domain-containing protein PB16A4.02c-like protein [Emericellopsis cladophorae]KAI6777722.1 putative PH domain-containing protein PB16A4.02c-like protein [Emericellopsis cladophorae]